jgi:hypothetical protein
VIKSDHIVRVVGSSSPETIHTYATNYGRVLISRTTYGLNCGSHGSNWQQTASFLYCAYFAFDFWVPKDYIFLLQQQNAFGYPGPDPNTHIYNLSEAQKKAYPFVASDGSALTAIFRHLKENLYNGKYVKNNVDIHNMDVYTRKVELEEEIVAFEKMKKEQTAVLEKQQVDMVAQLREMEVKKNKLVLVANKLKIGQANLDAQKVEFEEKMLENTSIDDLLDDVDLPVYAE